MRKMLLLKAGALALLATALISLAASADMEPQSTVPEPTSWLLFGIGALGGAWAFHRRGRG